METFFSDYSIIIIIGFIAWLMTLISHLQSDYQEDVDKIIWTIVLCTLSFLGMVLYWFMAPKKALHVRSEAELKKHFNTQK